MASLKFIVKSKRKGSFATVYARLCHGRDIDIICPSQFKIPPESWSNSTQGFKQRFCYSDSFSENDARDIENDMTDLRGEILKELNKKENIGVTLTKESLQRIISNFHDPCKEQRKNITLNSFIPIYIKEIETGVRLTEKRKERFKPLTIKNIKGFKVQFDEFQKTKNRRYNFDDITIDFYDEFVAYFISKNYRPNTIGRLIANLKMIMHASRDLGYHNNVEVDRKKFKTLKVETQNVYLTESEINAIYNLDLSDKPELDIARDIFLVGCFTAQRFSDYSRIRKENIKKIANGVYNIDLIQSKTGEQVIIPVKPELLSLLSKYKFSLPKTYEQKVNERIKKVCDEAKITELIEIEDIRGGLKIKRTVPKCELVKTHTARRSGCTNMYLAGIPTIDAMKISGHKTEREFLNYIKVSKEQTAQNLHDHPYFKSQLRIAK